MRRLTENRNNCRTMADTAHSDPGVVYGVILAGGQGSRMQYQAKPLLRLAGRPLIEHVIALARPQVETLVISVNEQQQGYRDLALPLIPDLPASQSGPLIGIYSALCWYRERDFQPGYLACFPADVPAFPGDLVASLCAAAAHPADESSPADRIAVPVIWCRTGQQIQPLFSLWPFAVFDALEAAVRAGIHGPRLFFRHYPNHPLQLPDPAPPLFFNINTPDELSEAERLLRAAREGVP